jgi:uncharacterized repeat protein (TIGR01451 family)
MQKKFYALMAMVICALAHVAAAQTASVSVDASVSSGSPAIAGSNVQFTIDANNEGPDDALNVVLTFDTPNDTTFISLTAPAGWSCTMPAFGGSGTITCSTADLPPGTAAHFLTVTTPSSTPRGTILNFSGSITSTTPDQSQNDNTFAISVPVDWVSQIALTKSGPASAFAGSTFAYTISINDQGPSSAGDLTLTDVLPPPLLFSSITAPGWSCSTPAVGANGTVSCTISDIPVGVTNVTLQVSTASSTPASSVQNDISLASTTDPQSPRTASATTAITKSADLGVTISDAPDPVNAGSNVTYSVSVTNNGPNDAANASLSVPLGASLNFVSITPPAGWSCSATTCTATTFPPSTANFTIVAQVRQGAPGGSTITTTANVSSATPDSNGANNSASTSTSVLSPANVAVVKSANGAPFFETQNVTYSVVMTNSGVAAQTDNPGDEMTDVLPPTLTLVSATASSGTAVADIPNNTVHWNGSIPAGGSVTVTIVATIKTGTVSNTATIHFDADGNGTNESTATSNTVTFAPQPASAIPALSELALLALAGMLSLLALTKLRA